MSIDHELVEVVRRAREILGRDTTMPRSLEELDDDDEGGESEGAEYVVFIICSP